MRIFSLNLFRLMGITAIGAVMLSSCSPEQDPYLRSLDTTVEPLVAVDSVNIEQYDLFQIHDVVNIDDEWLVMSSIQGDYKLLILNHVTSEHFFAIKKGRGPGEMINGNSLHKYEDGVCFYDSNNATCIKIRVEETVGNNKLIADTVGLFKSGPSKPIYMTTCGENGFISGNIIDKDIWYSYYDETGRIHSSVEALDFDEISDEPDAKFSFSLSSKYASNPGGTRVCVASVASPSLSFAHVDSGKLTEYKRWEMPPVGMVAGHVTPDHTSTFMGIDADNSYVYLAYSGHRLRNDILPTGECNHLIVYDWNGNPVKHYYLNRNICSIHVDGNNLWAASACPESCVYRFILE